LAATRAPETKYKHGNLEATPLVEDGIMYVPDGWGSVYAIDLTSGKRGTFPGNSIPKPTKPGPATSPAAASTTAVSRSGRTRSSRCRSTAACFALNKATGEKVWERKIARASDC